eukprot:TRINITY_DN4779_c0_g2_i1.p1 TRINITY_DN4779_c0_g2~~TRINITY_DN4779_c0_g2_i1.p1  ORF type:complete len:164 (-),score=33.12 TRINITY_DN4779_c0_g2_i1:372-863(-)
MKRNQSRSKTNQTVPSPSSFPENTLDFDKDEEDEDEDDSYPIVLLSSPTPLNLKKNEAKIRVSLDVKNDDGMNEESESNDMNGNSHIEDFGFDRGDVVEEILGMKKMMVGEHVQLMHFVKWGGKDIASWIPATTSNKKNPLIVLKYYESRIEFLSRKKRPIVQ